MRLYSHFAVDTLTNTYLVGPDGGGDAVLIDPSSFDGQLLELIERSRYYVRNVLLTHSNEEHLSGLRALRRVYDCTIYSASERVLGFTTQRVSDNEVLDVCCGDVRAISLPGHGTGSIAYYGSGFLFSGEAMSAAECGAVLNPYAKAVLLTNVTEKVLTLPDETVILPSVGPPSTVRLERDTFPMEDPTQISTYS
jgi:glyoxylase-like metal-dependent hydrolase (beta-lactamase superfamily II)